MHTDVRFNTFTQKRVLGSCLLIAAWCWANAGAMDWLWQSFRNASLLNLAIVGLAIAALLFQGTRHLKSDTTAEQPPPRIISFQPILQLAPLVMMLGAAGSAIALRWLIDIEQIQVILFGIGTYGLCGLFLAPVLWRKGLPAAILIACVLPFSAQFGSGLGFPVRVLTARAVEQWLATWHITAISSHDIIVLENGIAHVDLPCSGLKSLWTGTLFLLAVTWLENRQLGLRWFLVCLANLVMLVSANTVRVLLLVLTTHVLNQPQFAEILHVPLGLMGFIGACGLTWLLLRTVPQNALSATPGPATIRWSLRPASFKAQVFLLASIIALALVPHPPTAPPLAIATFQWPAAMVSDAIALTEAEELTFGDSPTVTSDKLRFQYGELAGSMLLVKSTSWYAYHPPELCFVGNGLKVDRMERQQLTSQVIARWLSLQNGRLSATYWFQSPQQTADDFLSRIWEYITRRQKTWVLVSILFNQPYNPDQPEISAFITTIHDAIDHSLNGA